MTFHISQKLRGRRPNTEPDGLAWTDLPEDPLHICLLWRLEPGLLVISTVAHSPQDAMRSLLLLGVRQCVVTSAVDETEPVAHVYYARLDA